MSTSICFWRLRRGGGVGSSLCGWVKHGALIRHVRAEVILDVSHTPAGELVLGQVQAQAAQLENCGLGFRSLKESPREYLWSIIVVPVEGCPEFSTFQKDFLLFCGLAFTCKCCLSMKRNTDWAGLFMTIPALSLRPKACRHCFS